MKNLLLSVICLLALAALPACKHLSCDKTKATTTEVENN